MVRHLALAMGMALALAARAPGGDDLKSASSGPLPPLKVLFLGDRGHHRPADRAAQIAPVFANRGIKVVYTEKLDDLSPKVLAEYDALLIYANIERIAPEQETALLDYVENGGALVPVHCASYCFLNSQKYVDLVGARFLRHGMERFATKTIAPEHPIVRGLEPFITWDETYVHEKHNEKGRRVLQVREENGRAEPWTWTRTQGKGRVFYTAYGHDGRTWQQPGFHDLLERGLRWAVRKGPVADGRPRLAAGLPPFQYRKTEVDIPNYVQARQWGAQGEPIRQMQRPLSPAESMRHMVVPHGFEPRLFAAEPQIARPICMTWDHRGRLWIAESVDYPNTKHPGKPGRDRIKICEDTDGDGRADKFTVFAEGLNVPTSILCARGGLIVLQAPDTLFLKDADGDDRADAREVLFTGWGTNDTHAGPSNLRWGLDNWIWGIVGYAGFDGTVGGERHRSGQAFFRFKPDGSKFEFIRNTNNNSWGVGLSEDGLVFGSTANGCPSVYMPVPNRYYEAVRGWSPRVLQNIAPGYEFYPITKHVRQVDWFGGFTAGAGHALYTARAYPEWYWNQTAFVAGPTGHLVAAYTLQRQGADVASYYGWNLLASDDEWTAPIAAEVGPDGQVWVIDWYNYIVQHNPTPRGFKTGRGNAYETPLRDRTHGRIYRIVYKERPIAPAPKLRADDPHSLLAALSNDNQFWRIRAQQLLVERGRADVVPELIELTGNPSVDAVGLNAGAVHALRALHGLGALDGLNVPALRASLAALKHPSAAVRRNALQVAPHGEETVRAVLNGGLFKDPDGQVRLATCLALADAPPSEVAGQALAVALRNGLARNDRPLADAATAAAARHDFAFLKTIAAQSPSKERAASIGPEALAIVERVAEHWARGAPADQAGALLSALRGGDAAANEAVLKGLARGWPRGRPGKLDQAAAGAVKQLAKELPANARGSLVRLVGPWNSTLLESIASELSTSLMAAARNESLSPARRATAAKELIELRSKSDETVEDLLELVAPRTPPELANGLIDAVAASAAPGTGKALVERLPALPPTARTRVVRALLARAEWAPLLLGALENHQLRLSELMLDQKQALAAHPSAEVARRARELLKRGGGLPDPDRQRVIDQIAPQVEHGGDPARGKLVFEQQCAKCHRHGGKGGEVGPDLSGTAALPREELLVNILDPSRSVEGNFVQYTVATTDGRVISGLMAAETKTTIELLDAEGKRQVVQREDVEELAASKKSLMPEGFEKQIAPEQLNDLLAFLTQRGKYLPLDLRKIATVVSTRGMFFDSRSTVERLVFPNWGPQTVDGVPFSLIDPRGDRVPNMVLLYGPQGTVPPKMPRSVELPCHVPARAIHMLSGVSGWGHPNGRDGSVSMIVRLHYADGSTEDHPLKNGVEFADYIRVIDVPGSKLAFNLHGRQMRCLAVHPEKKDTIDRIELIKGPDQTAPIVAAVTVEGFDN